MLWQQGSVVVIVDITYLMRLLNGSCVILSLLSVILILIYIQNQFRLIYSCLCCCGVRMMMILNLSLQNGEQRLPLLGSHQNINLFNPFNSCLVMSFCFPNSIVRPQTYIRKIKMETYLLQDTKFSNNNNDVEVEIATINIYYFTIIMI